MIKKTVRDQMYTVDTYLKYVKEGDICANAEVQRVAGSYDSREANGILYTALTSDHLPELILAECIEDNVTYIVDGAQRTAILMSFRYGNYKITTSIDNPVVEYMRKKRDKDGKVILKHGRIEYEEAEFNIRNKTFEMLPEELQKGFNDFQFRVVIHEECTKKRISELIKRYNTHKAMNTAQQAFTYLNNYASYVREDILTEKFFVDCEGYSDSEKLKGTLERVVTESIMLINHFDDWKKGSRAICEYLNNNSKIEEFESFRNNISRLGHIIDSSFYDKYTSKNSFIWFALFDKFTRYGLDDKRFADFITAFDSQLHNKIIVDIRYKDMENITYDKLDKEPGTKDKALIVAKLGLLEKLMDDFFYAEEVDIELEDTSANRETFIVENVGIDAEKLHEEFEFYEESLDDLVEKTIRIDSKLRNPENRVSLLAMLVYSYENDKDLDDWMEEYAKSNNTYFVNQKKNFLHMRDDFETFLLKKNGEVA